VTYSIFKNCQFINNTPNYLHKNGIALGINGDELLYYGNGYAKGFLVNCLFARNSDSSVSSNPSSSTLDLSLNAKFDIVNCTFADNGSTNHWGAPINLLRGTRVRIYNSIFFNNRANQIVLIDDPPDWPDTLEVYNSCIENGIDGIANYGSYNTFYYDSTNISDDPVFLGGEEFPYNINDLSPCIDAGTLNLPPSIEMPPTDLAGNPRIVGNSIDMGAYEWNPMVGFGNNKPTLKKSNSQIRLAPNPFNETTHILITTTRIATFNIYNQQGLLVKKLGQNTSNKFSADIPWNGNDDNGNPLPSGIYYVVMSRNGRTLESIKVVKE